MQRTLGTVLLAVLVVLAGCGGVLSGDSGNSNVETFTPMSVPTDKPTPTPVPQLAPGVTGQGIENPSALVAAHTSFLQNRSYTRRVNATALAPNGSVLVHTTITFRSGPSGEKFHSIVERNRSSPFRGQATLPVRSEAWWNGQQYFVKRTYANGTTTYSRLPASVARSNTATGALLFLLESLDTNNTVVAEWGVQNGTTLYRVRGTARTEWRANVSLRLLVDSRGVIHEYRTVQVFSSEQNISKNIYEVEFSKIGATDAPERPSWVDEAMNQTTPIAEETTTTTR